MKEFIEQQIITAVRGLLTGKVNEVLGDSQYQMPLIEFTKYEGRSAVVPVISISSCEQTEKERIIRLDSYTLTIIFNFPETLESELFCYAYSGAVGRAIFDNPTLGGIVNRAVITGKKYNQPKKPHYGEGWELIVAMRLTVEGIKP